MPLAGLLRLVRSAEGRLVPDLASRHAGRGMHLCPRVGCFVQAIERRAANRIFRSAVQTEDPLNLAQTFVDGLRSQLRESLRLVERSGLLQSGLQPVLRAICRGAAAFVLLAEDASEASRQEVEGALSGKRIQLERCLTVAELDSRSERADGVVAICHRGVARRVRAKTIQVASLVRSLRQWESESTEPLKGQLTGRTVRGKMRARGAGSSANG